MRVTAFSALRQISHLLEAVEKFHIHFISFSSSKQLRALFGPAHYIPLFSVSEMVSDWTPPMYSSRIALGSLQSQAPETQVKLSYLYFCEFRKLLCFSPFIHCHFICSFMKQHLSLYIILLLNHSFILISRHQTLQHFLLQLLTAFQGPLYTQFSGSHGKLLFFTLLHLYLQLSNFEYCST